MDIYPVNKTHQTIRKSLIKTDPNELIRTGIIDLMINLEKNNEFSVNVGNTCKMLAEKMKLGQQIWNDLDKNELGLKSDEIQEKRKLFIKRTNQLSNNKIHEKLYLK